MIARTLTTAALLASTFAAAAQADCPAAPGDLAAGLFVTVEDGFDMILRRTDAGQVETNMFADDPQPSLAFSRHGVMTQRYHATDDAGAIDPGSYFTVTYDSHLGQPDLAALAQSDAAWFGTAIQTAPSGDTLAWGETLWVSPHVEQVVMGDCIFDMQLVERSNGMPGRPGDVHRYAYLPALDVAVFLDTQVLVDRYADLPELPAVTRFEMLGDS